MLDVNAIKSVGSLRAITFSELFYSIFNTPKGGKIARALVNNLDHSFIPRLNHVIERCAQAAIETEEYDALLNKLGDIHEVMIAEKLLRQGGDDYSPDAINNSARLLSFIEERHIELAKRFFPQQFTPLDNVDYEAHSEQEALLMIQKKLNDKERIILLPFSSDSLPSDVDMDPLVDALLAADFPDYKDALTWTAAVSQIYRACCERIEARRLDAKRRAELFDVDEVELRALLLIPSLSTDRDIITYFGRVFHKSFEDVNAYSGLLYANDFFVDNEVFLHLLVEQSAYRLKYIAANKLYEKGVYAGAISAFVNLGSYRDSSRRAAQIREQWESCAVYDSDGFNYEGFDRNGFDRNGFDRDGFDRKGFNKEGRDRNGFDRDGFDEYGYDKFGYDRSGEFGFSEYE